MAVSAIANATGTKDDKTQVKAPQTMSGNDFLMLFMTQMQNQNPLEPLSNADMMQQISQISSLQMSSDLVTGINKIMNQGNLLQAGGLIGKTVEFLSPGGDSLTGTVATVNVDAQSKVTLSMVGGSSTPLDQIRKITG